MNARALPPEWMELAAQKGIPQSARAIAEKAGIATTTLTRLIFEGRTSSETVRRVAKVLDVPQDDIVALAGIKTKFGLWEPPREAHEMDGPTREAISNLIRVITRGVHGVADHDQKSDDPSDGGGVSSPPGRSSTPPAAPAAPVNLDDLRETKQGDAAHLRRAARKRSGPRPVDPGGEDTEGR